MANSTADNPFVLDTATATILPTGQFFEVYSVVWASGSLADVVLLEDGNSVAKWSCSGTIANNYVSKDFNPPLFFNGLRCSSLGSGKVYVYQKRTR